tara:strand:+ start:356 stop:697 length:342 start_codon:yes stop_codon:yes gene_type:complete
MLKLKDILTEVLNTYQVNADIFTDSKFNITDVLDQIRAIRKITIVRNITPEDYPQKSEVEYTLVTIKFITRGKPEEDMAKIKEDVLTSDMSDTDLRVPGVRTFTFKEDTLRRL